MAKTLLVKSIHYFDGHGAQMKTASISGSRSVFGDERGKVLYINKIG
jgi:hypothetical protein